jgi:aspartyl-tRNA(Asn)/glutamyl-tRNA(Gln) amidotransferase subunit A
MRPDLAYLDATEIAALVRARELSPVELVAALRQRAAELNPELNALITPFPDAERRAEAAEAEVARGGSLGPLHGVPFTIKDSLDTAGVRTTRGSRLFADHVPARDATVVSRLVAAGGIPLAKTNVPEFVLWWETDNLVFGRTVNPWNRERTSGGSSGGEAAAIAAGLSPFGIGSDLGGSIRLPAAFCGVAGLKPTHGRVPTTGHWPETLLPYMHVGFLARSVRDISLALSVASGPDGADPYAMPVPPPAALDGSEPAGRLRVGVLADRGFGPVDAGVLDAVRSAVSWLEELGCAVEEVEIPGVENNDWNVASLTLYSGGGSLFMRRTIAGREDDLHPFLQRRLSSRVDSIDDYVAAEDAVGELRADVERFFADHDVLLCPTVTRPAHGHDALEIEVAGESLPPRSTMRSTIPWDLAGSPALSVPVGVTEDGLPLAVQLVGPRFGDEIVLRAGLALERARGADLRPPL